MSQKIIIVGAGAAGLIAATRLAAHGFQVTILEARERVGGRIHTLRENFSQFVEAGAEFIHGNQPMTSTLLHQAGAMSTASEGQMYQRYKGKIAVDDSFNDDISEVTRELESLEEDMPISTFLADKFSGKKYRELRENIQGFVEGFDAADMDRVSALALKKEWSEGAQDEQLHVAGGYQQVIFELEKEAAEKGVAIALGKEVSQILLTKDGVHITTTDKQRYLADKVIVTVPLGVLQSDSIKFVPRLDSHQDAFKKMGYGGVIKFLFEFKEPFCAKRFVKLYPNASFIFTDLDIPTWWTQNPSSIPLLTGWLAGPAAKSAGVDNEALFHKAISTLSEIMECKTEEITQNIVAHHIENWIADPFARGAYSYATVEGRKMMEIVAKPVDEKLFFAGEAFYTGAASGTVEAALHSGAEVAETILQSVVVQ